MRCQRMPCSRIQSKTSFGGQYPRRPTCTKLRPGTTPDSMRRRIGEPCEYRLPNWLSPVSACASKCTMPRLPGRVRRGDCGGGRPGDRVIAADDHRDDASLRDVADAGADRGVRLLGHAGQAHRVAVVDDAQHIERRDLELEMPLRGLIRRGADAAGTEPGARAVRDAVVPGGADDRRRRGAPRRADRSSSAAGTRQKVVGPRYAGPSAYRSTVAKPIPRTAVQG